MKTIFALFLGLILLPLSAQAKEFTEGVNYEVVKETATETPEVMEFFSYYCPHCFKFEPIIKTLRANLDENVSIKKNHVDFLGQGMGPQLTRALAAAEMLNVEDKVSSMIFDQLHTQRRAINGQKDILAIFEQAGISNKEAQGAMESFPVVGLASQMKRNTETFNIRAVPAIIVNGKYQVNTGSVRSEEELIELITYLTKK
ncbi:thiol:disulfide interchange protein DsbA [Psychromonas sp. CNPT3]|uniref:thiol:disulfide interchange protein DsbA/DsbL n=1 Tax=Psychromonas sp. CNPT3 TaxID=314282 RepID=UPI00006E485C|nr:thiol:disulfide interchange protein DsbA/DsbL [Psychromonas sp. CNPT3]AGH82513.1 thiol:disulfide interchange protein DsbA [Psychromonas sp. CNPT3]